MNRNAILNAMEKKAKTIFDNDAGYKKDGKRGMMIVDIKDQKKAEQLHSSCRSFGTVFRDYGYDGGLVINNGTNFDALAHSKIAFSRRTQKNSGTNYYQVLGCESFWPGSIISDDGECICAFAGFAGEDDEIIARAGVACYESLKRTKKSLANESEADNGEVELDDEGEPKESKAGKTKKQ